MAYVRQNPHGLLILEKTAAPIIRKTDAYCLLIKIPARQVMTEGGIFLSEQIEHWERMTSNGAVVRCHTRLEAEEARSIVWSGVDDGHFLTVAVSSYDPCDDDIPYHDWIRGMRGRKLAALGLTESELPESQDQSLAFLSDKDWLANGPR